jgi:hypothetical protein
LHFCLGSNCDPPTSISCIAAVTGVPNHVQLVIWDGYRWLFAWAALNTASTYFCLPNSWDYWHEPPSLP